MIINFLKANNGDCILLTAKGDDGKFKNILIDGGMPQTYRFRNSKDRPENGDLKKTIDVLASKGEIFDLLILTHVDQDHVGGLVSWIENEPEAHKMIGTVWFNSGRLIKEYFKSIDNQIPDLMMFPRNTFQTTIREGVAFEKYISEHNKWQRQLIMSKDILDFYGLKFRFLSPGPDQLQELLDKWQHEEPDSVQTSREKDHSKPLEVLMDLDSQTSDEDFINNEEDTAPHNGSSLAFILTAEGMDYLFLGDAFPSVVCTGLTYFGYDEDKRKLAAQLVKISHHGSKGNTSRNLLRMIDSKNFIISTNSKKHHHPDKQLLARLLSCHPKCEIHFNYPNLINDIFTTEDLAKYSEFIPSGIDTLYY